MNMTKSLKLFNLMNNIPNENEDLELDLNSAIEQQKQSIYKPLKNFLNEVKMPDLFNKFAKQNIFKQEQIENITNSDLIKMNIPEKDRKKMLEYIKELNMKNELIIEGDFGTQCDSKHYFNDPSTDDILENERIQSELFKKAVEEFRNMGKEKKDIEMPVDKSMKSSTTNISENNNNNIINPKNFLFEIGNSDLLNLNNFALFANTGNDMKEDQELNPELVPTQACWNCYKIVETNKALIYEDRLFCSQNCINKYKSKKEVKCSYCHKNYFKFNGIFSGNKMFCSLKCYKDDANTIREVEDVDDDETKGQKKEEKNNDVEFAERIDILDI